eukprot:TRINITY_DN900_c0_g2_i3.p1 TRINITY_DN900_c0_g2~~TRINITY_DN900_c0_g2_i3.p1  ORF type:complete len:460 (+),score=130.77 TRINITY_DN900_c0_g2_i3:181-1560(+)
MCIRDRYQRRVRGTCIQLTWTNSPAHQAHSLVMGNQQVASQGQSHEVDGFEVVDHPDNEASPPEASQTPEAAPLSPSTIEEDPMAEPEVLPLDDALDNPDVDDVEMGEYVLHKFPQGRDTNLAPWLGRGSYATVYHGTHTPSRTRVAIKVIGVGKWYDKMKMNAGIKALRPQQLKYIESEIATLHSMRGHRHPNVITFHQVFRSQEGRYVYLVTELCEGGTLKDYLSSMLGVTSEQTEETARRFLRHLAGGLYYIKTRPGNSSFVHRDLKPENFLLSDHTANATLKIADFGFSAIADQEDGMMMSTVGTPYYMAPELCAKRPYDETVDLWAVGIVLFESVFGRVLVQMDSEVRDIPSLGIKLQGITSYRDLLLSDDEKELNSGLSEECQDLLDGLLQPIPEKRLTFQQFMSHPFIDLATAFVEQGQQLVKEVHQRELSQRAFKLLKEKLGELQQVRGEG